MVAHRVLRPGGRLVVQGGSPYFAADAFWGIEATLRDGRAGHPALPRRRPVLRGLGLLPGLGRRRSRPALRLPEPRPGAAPLPERRRPPGGGGVPARPGPAATSSPRRSTARRSSTTSAGAGRTTKASVPEPDERLAPAPPEVTPPRPTPTGSRRAGGPSPPTCGRCAATGTTGSSRVGQSVSFFGSMVTYVAVPYQVYELTRLVAGGGAGRGGADGGHPGPGLPRRGAGRRHRPPSPGATGPRPASSPAAWPCWATPPSTARRSGLVFVLAGAIAGLNAIQRPALQGLVPRIVDRDELTAAGAIDALTRTVGMIGGPAFAGRAPGRGGPRGGLRRRRRHLRRVPRRPQPHAGRPAAARRPSGPACGGSSRASATPAAGRS